MRERILGFIAYLIIRLLGMTLSYKLHFEDKSDEKKYQKFFQSNNPNTNTNCLLAFFHQDEMCFLNFYRGTRMCSLVSISKDGEIMATIGKLLGYETVRGSSSRRAVSGLIAAIKKVRAGYKMALAVDGPRGPIYKVKEGICAIHKKTESPIIPIRAFCSREKVFEKSWNKAKLPLPFSQVDIYVGKIGSYDTASLEKKLLELEKQFS